MSTTVSTVIEALVGLIVIGFFLAAMIPPTETGVSTLRGALNGTITGESLGTADGNGALDANTGHHLIIGATDYVLYNASGTPHTSWINTSLNVTFGTRTTRFLMEANGTANSTANSAITIDYIRGDTQAEEVADLPQLAYLIAVILAFVGIIYLYAGRG